MTRQRPDAAQPVLDLRAFPATEFCETHASQVYLSGARAYKVRKPVRFPFLDQSTAAQRRALALAELDVNAALAPGTYLGLREVLTNEGERDVAVEMRRFDEADTLAARLSDDRVMPGMLEAIGERIASFHAEAAHVDGGGCGAVLARVHRNTEELVGLLGDDLSVSELWSVTRPLEVFALRRAADFEERARAGVWRDGHGDLRAEHVVIDEHGLQIVDRLEFDPTLRADDVGADLAFLLMDLQHRGFAWAAEVVLGAYRDAGGDPGTDAMLAFWSAYRALVSLKVSLLRGAQPGGYAALERAASLLATAEQLTWRTRRPRIFVVCGPPASGKSTIARDLQRRSGLPVLASDAIRKESLALERTEHAPSEAYTAAASAQVYDSLGRRAAGALVTHGGAIVDATMGSAVNRGCFADALEDAAPVVYVECRAPDAELDHRAHTRLDDPTTASDATPAVAAALREQWEPLDEIPAARHLTIRSDQPTCRFLDDLERRLDALDEGFDHLDRGFDELEAHVLQMHLLDRTGA